MALKFPGSLTRKNPGNIVIHSLCMASTWELPTSNMLLSVLDMFGREYESPGDSTGRVYGK